AASTPASAAWATAAGVGSVGGVDPLAVCDGVAILGFDRWSPRRAGSDKSLSLPQRRLADAIPTTAPKASDRHTMDVSFGRPHQGDSRLRSEGDFGSTVSRARGMVGPLTGT